jgi:hypothetical protein
MALDTLTGDKDPKKSPVYQAVKAEAMRSLGQEQDYIKDQAAGGGRFYTGARISQQREAASDVVNRLNTILAQEASKERDRQIGLIPTAAALGEQESQEPLNTTMALQTYGALPRVLEQAKDDAALQEFLRTQYDYPLNIAQIAAGVQQAPLYSQKQFLPSTFQQIMSSLKLF